jgi:hypothetical protein
MQGGGGKGSTVDTVGVVVLSWNCNQGVPVSLSYLEIATRGALVPLFRPRLLSSVTALRRPPDLDVIVWMFDFPALDCARVFHQDPAYNGRLWFGLSWL